MKKLLRFLRGFVRHSLARRLVLTAVLVQIVLVALLVWQLVVREGDALEEQRVGRAEGVATMLATSGAPWLLSKDIAALDELVAAASSLKSLRYSYFTDPSGRVLAHSASRQAGSYQIDRANRSLSPTANSPQVVARTSDVVDVAAPVRIDGRLIGWARAGMNLSDIREGQRALAINAAQFGAAAILIGLFASILTARSVTRRLGDLAEVTERFRLGERGVRVANIGQDEVSLVGRGVNAMLNAVVESEQALKEVQRIAKVGSWSYDPRRPALVWSEEVYELFGWDPAGAPPTFDQFLLAVSDSQRGMIEQLVSADDRCNVANFNLEIVRPDGVKRVCWSEARVKERLVDGRPVLVGVCQDITERESAAAQLRQAQKMEAVGQLTGGLAHDFNNLLAVIIGNLDFLQEEIPEEADEEPIREALEAALRGAELTKQLLAFSRRQPLAPQPVNLNELISAMANLWRRTLGESIDVRTKLSKELWLTQADPAQVEAALLNLIINARDAMTTGGSLTVETRNATVEHGSEHFGQGDLDAGDYCVITVSDTGEGMTSEVAARVFEPFFTTKSVGHGSGLGLSMIYGFAKQSGGHVRIYSELGIGTAVSIYLPRTTEAPSTSPNAETLPLRTGDGETIVLVEDDDSVRKVTARQLHELGYRVLTASDGPEALSVLASNSTADLLMTDIVMPGGMNGLQLSKSAQEKYPGLRVLHASGFTQSGIEAHKFEGHMPLLNKPFRKADLAAKIRDVLDGPSPASPAAKQ